LGVRNYKILIIADLAGKLFSLLYAIYYCKDIVIRSVSDFSMNLKETMINISIGIKLMVANIASILIIGIVRFGIERTWDVSTFGKISLTLSISNLLMSFINAVGIIMYPMLRRLDEKKYSEVYITLRTFLIVPLLGFLIIFYPLKEILSMWLPEYAETMKYMAFVFPMCVYEGKMSLLINTYLKALRKEKLILSVNVISVVLSMITTLFFTILLKNLTLSVLLIVMLLAFRCVIAEIILSKLININVTKDIILEIVMSSIFIITGWVFNSWIGVGIYLLSYSFFLAIKGKDIATTIRFMKEKVIQQN
jgi:O-antigen/teichoic acid export membrane protein